MKNRNPIAVFLLGLITLGFYSWYWAVKTKGEMNKLGEKIPTAWIWLIPFVGSIWWYWEYSKSVERVTHEKLNWVMTLLVLLLLGNIGQAIVQDFFNNVESAGASIPTPAMATQLGAPGGDQPTGGGPSSNSSTLPDATSSNQQSPTTSPPSTPPTVG